MKILFSISLFGMLMLLPGANTVSAQIDSSLSYNEFLRQAVDFKSDLRQEIWVVNFWASWNGASLYSLDGIKDAYQVFREKPVRFVSISVDKIRSAWEKRVLQYSLPWEQLFVPKEADYAYLKRAFKHNSLPAIYIVNSSGQIRRVRDTQELMEQLSTEAQRLPNRPYTKPEKKPEVVAQPSGYPRVEGGWLVHKVRSGDTLYALQREYGVKVAEIKRINGLNSNNIKIGQLLKIERR